MRRIRVLPAAEAELRSAAEWYESKRVGLGIDFLAVVDEALTSIRDRPLASAPWRADRRYRRRTLRRFPYSVFFDVGDDEVIVVAVAHERRRPGYWRARK